MLESTRELAELLPAEMFSDFSNYLDGINELSIMSDRQQTLSAEAVQQIELTFMIRFLQINFLNTEQHYSNLVQFYSNLGLQGFEYDGNRYFTNDTFLGEDLRQVTYINLKYQLSAALQILIEDTQTSYLLDLQDDESIIRRVIRDTGQ